MSDSGVRVRIKEVGICPCGFRILCDHIEVGAEYVIHPDTITNGYKLMCGGCGQWHLNVTCVFVDQDGMYLPPAPLPLALFDLGEMN